MEYSIVDIKLNNIAFWKMYKFINLGNATKFYEDIFLSVFAFAPVEYLISKDVIGYNGNKATKGFDIWPT